MTEKDSATNTHDFIQRLNEGDLSVFTLIAEHSGCLSEEISLDKATYTLTLSIKQDSDESKIRFLNNIKYIFQKTSFTSVEYVTVKLKRKTVFGDFIQVEQLVIRYLANESLFDPVWVNNIDEVVISDKSADDFENCDAKEADKPCKEHYGTELPNEDTKDKRPITEREQLILYVKNGDNFALARLIEMEISKTQVRIVQELGVFVIKLTSSITLVPSFCKDRIINILNETALNLPVLRIEEIYVNNGKEAKKWCLYLKQENSSYIDNTVEIQKQSIGCLFVIVVLLFGWYFASSILNPESPSDVRQSQPPKPRLSKRFLGQYPGGYSLYLGSDDCIYVKNLSQLDLARTGTTLSEFKKAVEMQTGKKCVLFE